MSTNEHEQAMEQLDEIICPRCLGSSTVPAMSDNGPDAYEVEVCCDHCDGTGTAGAAYKVLSEYRSKTRAELVGLRYFKWHTQQEQKKFASLLPGAYYMDPPDGGSVEVLEQFRRMATDAGRYRLLRRGQHWSVVNGIGDTLRAEALDAAVDAALAPASQSPA